MSQSIELQGPIQEQGLGDKARALKEKMFAALGRSVAKTEQTTQEQTFEAAKAAGDELFAELQKLGRMNFSAHAHINDVLNDALKNPEMMVKVRLRVMEEGLKSGKTLTEEQWGELARKKLEDEDVQMWLSKFKN